MNTLVLWKKKGSFISSIKRSIFKIHNGNKLYAFNKVDLTQIIVCI